jgi:hypothetical protein
MVVVEGDLGPVLEAAGFLELGQGPIKRIVDGWLWWKEIASLPI